MYSMFIVLQITMTQCLLSTCFRSPVQLPPHVKREHVIDALLYFRFKDRLTRQKRQQHTTACKSVFQTVLSVRVATLYIFVTVAWERAA